MIKEAKIVKEKEKMKKKEVVVADSEKTEVAAAGGMKEGFDPEPSDIAAHLVKKHGKGKVTKDHVDAYEKDRDSNKGIDKEAVMKHVQKMSEEVDQMDEANMRFDPEAAARPKSSDVKNFLNRDKNPRAAAASKKYIRRMTKLGGLGPNQTKKDTEAHMKAHFEEVEQVSEDQASDMQKIQSMDKGSMTGGKAELKTHLKYLQAMHAHQKKHGLDTAKTKNKIEGVSRTLVQMGEEVELDEASKEGKDVMRNMRASMKAMDLRHGVDSDKRVSGYKMSPAVKAAQAKSDALSKVVKRPQAGTLAAAKMRNEEVEYIEEKLTAGDPASKWISDFVASDNPKFSGKTKKERINMALGAYYAAKKGKNEEVEHVEEAADPGKLRVVNKKVEAQASKDTKTSEKKSKATEKAINTAKSKKNPVNLNPVLAGDKVNNA